MFSLFSKIFSSSGVVYKAGSLIDEAFYTDSEKAEDKKEMKKFKANHQIELMKAYEPFKLAQRFIAFSFTFVFLFIMMNGILGSLYGLIDMENVKAAKDFANEMWLGEIMLTITGFYFGGGLADSIKRRKDTMGKSKAAGTKPVAIQEVEQTKEAKGIIVHCSDSPQGRGDNAATIDRWHKESGWYGIGYHYVILEDGTIEEGRPLGEYGAHAKGYNDYVGICLIGKYSFTDEQFNSLETLCKGFNTHNIIGHYKVSAKTCPNFNVEYFVEQRKL